jgi:futalosine hydrolase
MKVVITAATAPEWGPASQAIKPVYTDGTGGIKVIFHKSGVGMLASTFSLTRLLLDEKPGLVVQAGIAGCFDTNVQLGIVTAIQEDILGDTGVEENGIWKDVFDLNLENPASLPFTNGKLVNPFFYKYNLLSLPAVTAVTVNEITTRPGRKAQLVEKYGPFIESMEGAPLHYVCSMLNVPFIQIRAVSNYIGERNKANWKIKDAIINLNKALLEYLDKLNESV